VYEGRDHETDALKWIAAPVDLVFGSHSKLRAIAEVRTENGGEEKFVQDFVDAWIEVMIPNRFDLDRRCWRAFASRRGGRCDPGAKQPPRGAFWSVAGTRSGGLRPSGCAAGSTFQERIWRKMAKVDLTDSHSCASYLPRFAG
jgi:hypothetical protein